MNLSKNVKIVKALDYASGTADRSGATLDMQGYQGVMMVVQFAAVAAGAVVAIKAQQGAAADLADAADLAGSKIAVADDDDNQVFVLDIYRPAERYVRVVIDNDASNASAQSAVYYQYGGTELPVSNNVTDAVTAELHVSPAEGTA
jgi:hypothetical protein